MNKLPCPSCGRYHEVHEYVQMLTADHAFRVALNVPSQIATLVMQYTELFAPAQQSLSLKRRANLISQMPLDTDPNAIAYAIEQMLAYQADGKLTLPLKNHNYLKKVMESYVAPEVADAKRFELSEKQVRHFAYELVNDSIYQQKAQVGESHAQFLLRTERALSDPKRVEQLLPHLERVGFDLNLRQGGVR